MTNLLFKYNHDKHTIDKVDKDGNVLGSYAIRRSASGNEFASVYHNNSTYVVQRWKVQAAEQKLIPPEFVIESQRGKKIYTCKWLHNDKFNNIMPYVFKHGQLVGMVDWTL
jgi:hypothetical protein